MIASMNDCGEQTEQKNEKINALICRRELSNQKVTKKADVSERYLEG